CFCPQCSCSHRALHSSPARRSSDLAPDPARVATVAAAATQAAVTWAREQPWAVRSKIVLAGNSVGGLATAALAATDPEGVVAYRSEEHTSELQSREKLVCRLLLEKK